MSEITLLLVRAELQGFGVFLGAVMNCVYVGKM